VKPRSPRRLLALVLCGGIAVGGCVVEPGSVEDGTGIIGVYTVNGVDPHGTEYTGTAVIEPADDSTAGGDGTYVVEWLITAAIQQGTGVLDGDTFTVEWETLGDVGFDASGSAVYTVEDDGTLRGTKMVDGLDDPGTEEIFPEA
jgi:hypothetical protein